MVKKKIKRKPARRRVAPKKMMPKMGHRSVGLMKLSAMAFILFLITVWPAAMNLVHSIHWGWFLAATIVFGVWAMKGHCCKY